MPPSSMAPSEEESQREEEKSIGPEKAVSGAENECESSLEPHEAVVHLLDEEEEESSSASSAGEVASHQRNDHGNEGTEVTSAPGSLEKASSALPFANEDQKELRSDDKPCVLEEEEANPKHPDNNSCADYGYEQAVPTPKQEKDKPLNRRASLSVLLKRSKEPHHSAKPVVNRRASLSAILKRNHKQDPLVVAFDTSETDGAPQKLVNRRGSLSAMIKRTFSPKEGLAPVDFGYETASPDPKNDAPKPVNRRGSITAMIKRTFSPKEGLAPVDYGYHAETTAQHGDVHATPPVNRRGSLSAMIKRTFSPKDGLSPVDYGYEDAAPEVAAARGDGDEDSNKPPAAVNRRESISAILKRTKSPISILKRPKSILKRPKDRVPTPPPSPTDEGYGYEHATPSLGGGELRSPVNRRGSISDFIKNKGKLIFGDAKVCEFEKHKPACTVKDQVPENKQIRFRRLSLTFRPKNYDGDTDGSDDASRWSASSEAKAPASPRAPNRKKSMDLDPSQLSSPLSPRKPSRRMSSELTGIVLPPPLQPCRRHSFDSSELPRNKSASAPRVPNRRGSMDGSSGPKFPKRRGSVDNSGPMLPSRRGSIDRSGDSAPGFFRRRNSIDKSAQSAERSELASEHIVNCKVGTPVETVTCSGPRFPNRRSSIDKSSLPTMTTDIINCKMVWSPEEIGEPCAPRVPSRNDSFGIAAN